MAYLPDLKNHSIWNVNKSPINRINRTPRYWLKKVKQWITHVTKTILKYFTTTQHTSNDKRGLRFKKFTNKKFLHLRMEKKQKNEELFNIKKKWERKVKEKTNLEVNTRDVVALSKHEYQLRKSLLLVQQPFEKESSTIWRMRTIPLDFFDTYRGKGVVKGLILDNYNVK